ncbi:putative IS701 family ISAzvi8-like transposase [Streptomyces rapamycinicus NRRL 5491]|nr:putative IS701 family ISAzvi8-like transposase [Streptomyces rapamycinicus NRRL 5491]
MLDGRRRSVQPMAERLPDGDEQNLGQFVNQSPWDPGADAAAERGADGAADRLGCLGGKMSVGVGHQHCGALGKQANCQVAVTMHAVSEDPGSRLLQWRPFLPR